VVGARGSAEELLGEDLDSRSVSPPVHDF